MIATVRTPPIYKSDIDALQVCSWCWPHRSLSLVFPDLERLKIKITHGMCPSCLSRTLTQIRPEVTR